ncbi:MAG TPA: 1-phosphofructokinase [Candidatus Coproplasma stercorigallinarum]|nr:1-phosphofructokinase [Candidatus Coproplasma stercorigallinarum]
MIYTVTFNPSLDYYVKVNNLKSGIVNRTSTEYITVGGKGLNVSLALKELGNPSYALGFVAGFTGRAIDEKVSALGLEHEFLEVEGQSRINVKIKSTTETDINGTGALVTEDDVARLTKRLKALLKDGDWLIICGSVPPPLDDKTYENLLKKIKTVKNINVVVDACGGLLTNTLKYRPFLIKPNIFELSEIFGLKTLPNTKEIAACARTLQKQGARNVIVSMGSDGAVMVTETDQAMYVRAARGQLVNSVGAGDSMIAGFIHEYLASGNYFSALNFATAAGSACAFTQHLATREQIEYIESLML